jgi:spermidine/putrescine transport system permease protein
MKKKRSVMHSIAAAPHIFWAILFIILPLLIVIFYAFTDDAGAFSLENIMSLGEYVPIFVLSLELSVIATFVCLLVGYPLAYIMARAKPEHQKIFVMLLMLPMWTNLLIRTYSIMAILDDGGLINTILGTSMHIVGTKGAVIFGMVYDFLPYMVLPIFTAMTKLDQRYIEASHDLGCNGWQTMTRVVLPLTMSGVISGVTMVFVPSISTFYISQKLGAGKIDLVGDTIERLFQNTATYGVGAAISLVMMILILISVGVMNRFSGDDEGDRKGGAIK